MPNATTSRSFKIWFSLLGFALCLLVGLLFILHYSQRQSLLNRDLRAEDALVAAANRMDREFLRFRQALSEHDKANNALEQLQIRNEALSARVRELKESPQGGLFLASPERALVMERLQSLQTFATKLSQTYTLDPAELQGLRQLTDGLAPEVINITGQATAWGARQSTLQRDQWLQGNMRILVVSALIVLLLTVALGVLALQYQRRVRAQAKSQQLTDYFRETQIKAESASRGKSRFLANMSHELRTPFNGIYGMLSLLGTTTLSEQQADYLKTANASASHLLNVLNDILDLSALEEGKINLQTGPVDLHQMMRDVEEVMRPQAQGKNLQYTVHVAANVPRWVVLDEKRVKQILFNLVNNAIKFTNQGSVTVQLDRVGAAVNPSGQMTLAVRVEDTGIGIPSEALEKLFQRFNQVHNGLNDEYGGTGLGLEISQSLAQLMDGHIKVKSAAGSGSCFTLRIPTTLATPKAPARERPAFVLDPPTRAERAYRILVVEDNQVNQKFMDILLKRMGYHTTFCENGLLAVQRVQTEPFDLVLMDLHMPVMNGVDATRAIRALDHPASKLPIIALTADVMSDAHDQAMDAGVNQFVTKPIHLARLQEAIHLHLAPPPEPTRFSVL